MKRLLSAIALCVSLPLAAQQLPARLPPIADFFRSPAFSQPKLSPDGRPGDAALDLAVFDLTNP